ncbi:UDP-glucose 4-epimerase GalE, partial [Elusimicrobiota bacterium]
MISKGEILVVGGAGYIGSQCCKELKKAGYKPITFDNLCTGHKENVKWGPFIDGDLTFPELLDHAFTAHKIQGVMHFAAHSLVGESMENPAKYYRNNVGGTLNLLEAMTRHQVDKFIFSSTAATFGMPKKIPIDEAHPQNPINPYGKSKLAVEKMLEDFDQAHGIKYTSLRYFNAAGADPDKETGEKHDPETHLIPLVLDAAAGRRDSIKVFGTDYDTPDGTCIRDYVHT